LKNYIVIRDPLMPYVYLLLVSSSVSPLFCQKLLGNRTCIISNDTELNYRAQV